MIVVYRLSQESATVLDEAGLLSDRERESIGEYHDYLVDDLDIDYRVVTSTSSDPILDESVDVYEGLEVGDRSERGRGLLLLVNPVQDLVRLEVGYALEGIYPDAFVAYVERDQMVPFFADGRVADGILAATELIVDRAQRAGLDSGYGADEIWMMGSGGAGAQMDAQLDGGDASAAPRTGFSSIRPAGSPEDALVLYFQAMNDRNGDPNLPIYSMESRMLLDGRTLTPAQMDNVMRTYRDCTAEPVRFDESARLAVIRYNPADRQCSPWFFVKSDDAWTFDLMTMSMAIRFGRSNAWHRSEVGFGEYAFAFEDWTFDGSGFPMP